MIAKRHWRSGANSRIHFAVFVSISFSVWTSVQSENGTKVAIQPNKTLKSFPPASWTNVLKLETISTGLENSKKSKSVPHSSFSTKSSGSFFSRHFGFFVKFAKSLLSTWFHDEKWTAQVAHRRLDELKTTLVKYYAKSSLESTGREKGIGFPSLEGALLSLAFLTFSVLLIDLIQTLLTRLRVTTAAPAPAMAGRQLNLNGAHNLLSNGLHMSPQDAQHEMMTTLSSKVLSSIEKPLS